MRLNACLRIVTADRLAFKASTDLSMFGQMSVDSKISQSSSEPIHGESSNQQIEMTSRTPCDAVDCAEGRGVEGRGVEVGYESTRKSPEMEFVPVEPKDLFESGLSEAEIESLILKFLHFYFFREQLFVKHTHCLYFYQFWLPLLLLECSLGGLFFLMVLRQFERMA